MTTKKLICSLMLFLPDTVFIHNNFFGEGGPWILFSYIESCSNIILDKALSYLKKCFKLCTRITTRNIQRTPCKQNVPSHYDTKKPKNTHKTLKKSQQISLFFQTCMWVISWRDQQSFNKQIAPRLEHMYYHKILCLTSKATGWCWRHRNQRQYQLCAIVIIDNSVTSNGQTSIKVKQYTS